MMENIDYEKFVKKFNKKTTDDCYTPPKVYESIKEHIVNKYKLHDKKIIRPFFPGGDYKNFEYNEKTVVIDNPPFSILSEIKHFYLEKNIKFFLFAPQMTLFSSDIEDISYYPIGAVIEYENNAKVSTSFITNLENSTIVLDKELKENIEKLQENKAKKLNRYIYPPEIVTPSRLKQVLELGEQIEFKKTELFYIVRLDAHDNYVTERGNKPKLFGGGFLTNNKKYIETIKKIEGDIQRNNMSRWIYLELSDREKEILSKLGVEK